MSVMRIVAEAVEHYGKPVEEYLVAPPIDPVFKKLAVLDRLRAHMTKAFPKLTFIISNEFPYRTHDEFTVMPVMSAPHPTNPDAMLMRRQPTQHELDKIQAALQGFDPEAPLPFLH
ncbi:hypothetical protein ASG43_20615 [Aureimonas sp. Leaf454]|uniref:hypothetical protein n=1 Tax=Aureimonas sp. Leaf454 TaxID=1736381 RepID=UPI000701E764|nr:hypothetical protein [Aureimonas sp. Leaf454]KQT51985.1 hypothetical protein ASG43_20615 [Aureimonas sp. Leaf454]